ncbi:galactose-3-O-sulfotransferase 2 [Tiliqua scincoides]|uniref:galactose-3-O-sulfotransferase 2 n=1 Tax=Tiliqua scincoides TaxID=71010 RepID=UPI00346314D4
MGLSQKIWAPTHTAGHVLDLVFTAGQGASDLDVEEIKITPLSWTDHFLLVQPEDVDRLLWSVRPSACLLDPCPAWLIRAASGGLAEWTGRVVNSSLREGTMPLSFKQAVVRPLLKKPSLDSTVLDNYWPVSNIPFLGKVAGTLADGEKQVPSWYRSSGRQWPVFYFDTKPCKPITNVMFLKTHKTASSTILNILYRFSEKHNLTVALPTGPHVHLGYPRYFKATFVEEFKTIGQNFNIMCNHLRFSLPQVRRLMPNDTFYFTILRNPIALLESSYVYYKNIPAFRKSKDVNEFLSSPWSYYNMSEKDRNFYARNNMWFDLGYDNNAVYDEDHIQSIIQDIEQNFQLMLLADYFDESMILLKNTLCWDLDDVVYFKLNSRSLESVQRLTSESQDKVKEWCALDWKLYKHFNNTFWSKIQEKVGLRALYKEVTLLQKRQKELMELCLLDEAGIDGNKIKDRKLKPFQSGQAKILGYNLKNDLENVTLKICQKLILPELQYMAYLYSHQFPNKTRKPIDFPRDR